MILRVFIISFFVHAGFAPAAESHVRDHLNSHADTSQITQTQSADLHDSHDGEHSKEDHERELAGIEACCDSEPASFSTPAAPEVFISLYLPSVTELLSIDISLVLPPPRLAA